jgi:transcriptional regulator with XRE-family HTH domain
VESVWLSGHAAYVKDVPIATRLKELRERAGLSMAEMARLLGLKGASSYQRYEDPSTFKRKYLPREKVDLLIQLVGRGSPPITIVEIETLAGPVDPASSIHQAFLSFASILSSEQRRELLKALKMLEENSDNS